MCFGAAQWPVMTGPAGRPGADGENPSLQELRRDVNDDAVVDHFVADFLELLDERLLGLERLLQRHRIEDSVTALLTIETSSLMVGAHDLAATAATLRRAVGSADVHIVPGLYDELLAASERTKAMLTEP